MLADMEEIARGIARKKDITDIASDKKRNSPSKITLLNLLRKVYSASYNELVHVKEASETIMCLIESEEFLSKVRPQHARKDYDYVSILSALLWTKQYIATGERMKLRLAYVVPIEERDDPKYKKGPYPYNALILVSDSGTKEVTFNGISVAIVAVQEDIYDVEMEGEN